ncbi:Calcium channel YVC1 [Grifola frondosa]|uniref:Calcium channel YVC1 n=1 Tax=Grifola frondosa TaxID=5627 RepID=A0A1C7MCV0_GRIFR|nr:Calcium channel YVC1 [Grifola frondosa]
MCAVLRMPVMDCVGFYGYEPASLAIAEHEQRILRVMFRTPLEEFWLRWPFLLMAAIDAALKSLPWSANTIRSRSNVEYLATSSPQPYLFSANTLIPSSSASHTVQFGDMSEAQERQPLLCAQDIEATEVYPIIQMIRFVRGFDFDILSTAYRLVDHIGCHDTPLTYESMASPDLMYSLVRPLREKYSAIQQRGNMSVVFCLLINRVYFFRDRHLNTAPLSRSRAALCEILAIHALSQHAGNMLELALAITTSWPEEREDDLEDRVGNAIEMAILGQAKRFIKSSACQKVIDGIWSGKIVYQADSSRSILSDTYKRNPIHFYDPYRAPLLDHYRLKVPAIRSVLEYLNFLVLFIFFVIALEFNERDKLNASELVFMIYALGFTLEKIAAMQEHGIKVYFKGTWNGFDLAFVTLYCTYAIMRIVGVYNHRPWARETGVDCLALVAVLMFPRLVFVTFKNNVMVLSLRAMIVQFVILMLIAAFCFCGFMYAIWTLGKGSGFSAGQIAWWMIDLWFGLDASLFENASAFHPVFGPLLMITYACLSNTLLLTVLVSILSHTFSTINDDAVAEAMFRRAVSTIEGVKADSLFSYQPPVNLVALCVMLPASYILTPRWFHKVNVFMIRLTSFPILLFIAFYERQAKRSGSFTFYETVSAAAEKLFDTLPRHLKRLTFFEGLTGPDADIDAIFELDEEFGDSALDMEETTHISAMQAANRRRLSQVSRRRPSHGSQNGAPPTSHTPPASPGKAEQSPAGSSTIPLPRQRVHSIVNRGLELAQSASSPLAQIFQPLVMDDDGPEEQQQDGANVVSYGPVTRRRLSSMHAFNQRRPTTESVPSSNANTDHAQSTALRRFPSATARMVASPLSESTDERREPQETAEQIEEEVHPTATVWEKRFDNIEERQKRIEDLLVQLSHSMQR